MTIVGAIMLVTVIIISLEVAVVGLAQASFEVSTQLTLSLLLNVVLE
jgi:hypothetical protein